MNVKIPSDIAAGDYLLRAEALALHTAGSLKGAQFYMTCCMSSSLLSPLFSLCPSRSLSILFPGAMRET